MDVLSLIHGVEVVVSGLPYCYVVLMLRSDVDAIFSSF